MACPIAPLIIPSAPAPDTGLSRWPGASGDPNWPLKGDGNEDSDWIGPLVRCDRIGLERRRTNVGASDRFRLARCPLDELGERRRRSSLLRRTAPRQQFGRRPGPRPARFEERDHRFERLFARRQGAHSRGRQGLLAWSGPRLFEIAGVRPRLQACEEAPVASRTSAPSRSGTPSPCHRRVRACGTRRPASDRGGSLRGSHASRAGRTGNS